MRPPKYISMIVFMFLFACSNGSGPTITPIIPTQRSPVVLPPTWTLTATSIPSHTPVRSPTLTFTPFPSATPLPATWTRTPTPDPRTPTVTSTTTPTTDPSCYVFALEAGVPIQSAPYIDPYRVLPTMSPTTTYQATGIYSTYYELALDDEPVGWVDTRQLTLASQGPGCYQLPSDTRSLSDFPGLCTIVPGDFEIFTDRALQVPYQPITSTQTYVVLLNSAEVVLISTGESGSGLFVDARQAQPSGDCDTVPSTGISTTNGWLWSQPDGEKGEAFAPLLPGYPVFIQKGPVEGPGPPSTSQTGAWYYVLVSPAAEGLSGWVWSSRIFID